jgi:hypothetical protein
VGGYYENRCRELGWGGMDWIDLGLDRVQWWVVSMVMNLQVPLNVNNFWSS